MSLTRPIQILPPLLHHPLFEVGTGAPEMTLRLMDRLIDADQRFVEKGDPASHPSSRHRDNPSVQADLPSHIGVVAYFQGALERSVGFRKLPQAKVGLGHEEEGIIGPATVLVGLVPLGGLGDDLAIPLPTRLFLARQA
jgi:hypothetical protein